MYIQKASSCRKSIRQTKDYKKKKKRQKMLITRRELRNKGRESLEVSPQTLDHSKREPLKEASN